MQNLAVPRVAVWQFGSAMDLVVPNLAVLRTVVWQCHEFGSARFGSATDLAVPNLTEPRTAVWRFDSNTDLAVPHRHYHER